MPSIEHAGENWIRLVDHLNLLEIEHTQTTQSVRERVEKRFVPLPATYMTAKEANRYNQALTDLLKDLEAPVEGDKKS